MLDRYTVDVCLGDAVVYRAPNGCTVEQLLQVLGVKKGSGGEAFQLVGELTKGACSDPEVPSNLLYIRNADHLEIVGAVDKEFRLNREFAIRIQMAEFVTKAEAIAQPSYLLNPDNYDYVWWKLHSL